MITLAALGLNISLFWLFFLGMAVGLIGGFIGVGGGYMVTPALVVMGVPGYAAVGSDITHMAGKSIISSLRHWQMGNIDMKLAVTMIAGTMGGEELGVRLINLFKVHGTSSEVVLVVSAVITSVIGVFTYWETSRARRKLNAIKESGKEPPNDLYMTTIARKIQSFHIWPMMYFPKSRVRISLWVVLMVGLLTGFLAGFFGVGGGFVRMPSMIYLIGVPSILAVGTDLFEIVISGAYGLIRHTMSGNVVIEISVVMLLGACIGAQVGSLATRYVRGLSVRYILAYSVVLSAIGSVIKLVYLLTGSTISWMQTSANILTFGSTGLLMLMILALMVFGVMYRQGRRVPAWLELYLDKSD